MVVVKLVKSFSPLLSAIALGVSSLAFIVSFSLSPYYRFTVHRHRGAKRTGVFGG